jgi:malonyl-CoA O-methyltransferase
MNKIDKNFVKKSFNLSATTYDNYAGLQNRMAEEVLNFLDPDCSFVSRALDIGMGTGNLTSGIQKKFQDAEVHGCDIAINMIMRAKGKLFHQNKNNLFLASDAEFLPYKDNTFDLIASSFTFQWLEEFDSALDEVARVLMPGGAFVFSVFGGKTFIELRESFKKACVDTGYNLGEALDFPLTEDKIKKVFFSCDFIEPLIKKSIVIKKYNSVDDIVRAIKGMGARNASVYRNKTLGVRKVWKKTVEIYEHDFGMINEIPATFEIIMGRVQKQY